MKNKIKFQVKVVRVGALATDLLASGNMIIFDNTPNEALAEVCFMHEHGEIQVPIEVGDTVQLGKRSFIITAIGNEAQKTLRDFGHCTFSFTGDKTVELPGQMNLYGNLPPLPLQVGDTIAIFKHL